MTNQKLAARNLRLEMIKYSKELADQLEKVKHIKEYKYLVTNIRSVMNLYTAQMESFIAALLIYADRQNWHLEDPSSFRVDIKGYELAERVLNGEEVKLEYNNDDKITS